MARQRQTGQRVALALLKAWILFMILGTVEILPATPKP